ncbi:hypothetical protein KCP73_13705 [Salmonella enterica subsp. enterica]|nr:hypothetical protein KCP73_13705 [Salmonella enterica subsp. enterica]
MLDILAGLPRYRHPRIRAAFSKVSNFPTLTALIASDCGQVYSASPGAASGDTAVGRVMAQASTMMIMR